MKLTKRHVGRLLFAAVIGIMLLAVSGCSSSPAAGPAPSPAPGVAISGPNDSIVRVQLQLFMDLVNGSATRLNVFIYTSEDVSGLANPTKDKLSSQIEVETDQDISNFMMGQIVNAHIQQKTKPGGETYYYIYDLTPAE